MKKELAKRDDVSEEKPLQLNSSSDGQDEDFRLETDESVEINLKVKIISMSALTKTKSPFMQSRKTKETR